MNETGAKKLMAELSKLEKTPIEGTVIEIQDELKKLIITMNGPPGTAYSEGKFKLSIEFPNHYPFKPPDIVFITTIFHPNVYSDGTICLDILSDKWTPVYTLEAIILSIQALLEDPNPDSPANVDAAKLYRSNKSEFFEKAKSFIDKKH